MVRSSSLWDAEQRFILFVKEGRWHVLGVKNRPYQTQNSSSSSEACKRIEAVLHVSECQLAHSPPETMSMGSMVPWLILEFWVGFQCHTPWPAHLESKYLLLFPEPPVLPLPKCGLF